MHGEEHYIKKQVNQLRKHRILNQNKYNLCQIRRLFTSIVGIFIQLLWMIKARPIHGVVEVLPIIKDSVDKATVKMSITPHQFTYQMISLLLKYLQVVFTLLLYAAIMSYMLGVLVAMVNVVMENFKKLINLSL